jgi:hypothetical protein
VFLPIFCLDVQLDLLAAGVRFYLLNAWSTQKYSIQGDLLVQIRRTLLTDSFEGSRKHPQKGITVIYPLQIRRELPNSHRELGRGHLLYHFSPYQVETLNMLPEITAPLIVIEVVF